MKRFVPEYAAPPRFYAIAYRDYLRCANVCYPVGIHVIAGLWERFSDWFMYQMFPHRKHQLLTLREIEENQRYERFVAWNEGKRAAADYYECRGMRMLGIANGQIDPKKLSEWDVMREPRNPYDTPRY